MQAAPICKWTLIGAIFLYTATCAPAIPQSGNFQSTSNVDGKFQLLKSISSPSALPPSQNLTTNTDNCVDSTRWTAPGWRIDDCYSAVQQLYLRDVYNKPGDIYEFLPSRSLRPHTDYPVTYTPRTYTVST